jgi:RES domain-containing protein
VRLYRIADRRFGPTDGEGARRFGGRWNSPGRAVIYACTSLPGAMLEKLVHTGRRFPHNQVCVTFELPDDLPIRDLSLPQVPGWDAPDQDVSRRVGDAWLTEAPTAVLLVPSVVFEIERNALINSAHPDFAQVRVIDISPVRWDARLFETAP